MTVPVEALLAAAEQRLTNLGRENLMLAARVIDLERQLQAAGQQGVGLQGAAGDVG